MDNIYHDDNLRLQQEFGARALANRLQKFFVHDEITDRDKAFIESRDML